MPDERPVISILIATFNAAKTLDRCLDSLLAQSFQHFDVLIADAVSTDGTTAVLSRRCHELSYWHSRPDDGIYDAWNQLLPHARGEYICFLGADDALRSPDALRDLVKAIDGRRYDLVSTVGQLRDAKWQPRGKFGGAWDYPTAPRRLGVCHPGLLHHSSLFKRFGLFDNRYRIAADLEFLLRLPRDISTLHLNQVMVDVQDDGISRKHFWQRLRERREIHRRCPRVGPVRAWIYWLDKAWRRPIALALGLPH